MAGKPDLIENTVIERSAISRLFSVFEQINASRDLNNVLREIVECARDLTGARYGLITAKDDSSQSVDLVTSGFAPKWLELLMKKSGGHRLFHHLQELTGPTQIKDLRTFVRKLGMSAHLFPKCSFQCAPLHHRETRLGGFYLADKAGELEFSHEDKRTLLLFSALAATAMANARISNSERRTRTTLKALLNTAPAGIIVFNARSGKSVSVNHECQRIADVISPGSTPDEVLRVLKYRSDDGSEFSLDETSLAELLSQAKTIRDKEIAAWMPDGGNITLLISATPIVSAADKVESVVVTLRDLSPIQEIERTRAEFVGMVSHELRAPLTSIKGAAVALLDSPQELDRAELREYLRIIDEQTNLMRGLVSDLQDFGCVEIGAFSVLPEPEEVQSLIEHARRTFIGGDNSQNIVVDLPLKLPRVYAERRRIEQVLTNLLSNSVRLSPGSSSIRIEAKRNNSDVAISVTDEGCGLSSEQLLHIFQKYAVSGTDQGDQARLGLGLAICKGIIVAHGGRIWAESKGPGQGARFTFTLRAVVNEERTGKARAAANKSELVNIDREPPCVLVVDDDPRALRYMRETLNSSGYKAVVTSDYQDLPKLLEMHSPQLVLLDLVLPGIDGIELMSRLPQLAQLPTIIISVYGRDETVAKAIESGAADFIVKPVSSQELVARIKAALRKQMGPTYLTLGDLVICDEHRSVTIAGQTIGFTATEYELLRIFSINTEKVLSHDYLMNQIWGTRNVTDRRRSRTFIKKIRRKLESSFGKTPRIESVRGVGYRMTLT